MAGEEIDFRKMTAVLRRQWRFIVAIGLVLGAIAAFKVLTLPNWYTAEAVLLVDPQQAKLGLVDAGQVTPPPDPGLVRSEVELMTDLAVVLDVIKRLDLLADPEFAALAVPPARHWWSPSLLAEKLGALASRLSGDAAAAQMPQTAASGSSDDFDPIQRLSQTLLKHATVMNDGRSFVVRLRFEWTDRDQAARVANAWADAFLARELAVKFEAAGKTEDWLRARTAELQKTVHDSERVVQEYRDAHQLLEVKGATVTLQQLNELNTELVKASAELSIKESAVSQLQSQLKRGVTDSSSSVLASPLIQRLREQEADASRRLSDLLTSFGEQHPTVKRVRSEIRDIEGKIRTEIGKVMAAAEADAAAARLRLAEIRKQLDLSRTAAIEADGAQVRLKQLEREAQANRAILAQFMLQSKESDARQGIERASVRLVSPAMRPDLPSFPNRTLLLAAGFIGAFSLGAVGAFGRERLTRKFVDPAGLQQETEVALLGMLPEARLPRGTRLSDYIVHYPRSEVGEAVRTIRTRLFVALSAELPAAHTGRNARVVLVTSAVPDEGKTTLAVALSRSAALSGQRVLLVDADIRRPTVAAELRDESPGASRDLAHRLLSEGHDLDRLIAVDRASGLHYVSAAATGDDPQEILSSRVMRDFLETSRRSYDLIIIDSPPVLVVSDAVILSGLSDGVLYVMRWESTPKAAVIGAIRVLRATGSRFAGLVMSRVDTRHMLDDWVADVGLVAGRYDDYYRGPTSRRGRVRGLPPAARQTSDAADSPAGG
jgi:capsular exopolysaccharide synthesis family protein